MRLSSISAVSPAATRRATFRATAPICRSSWRTPLSRVYLLTTAITASSVNVIPFSPKPILLELARNEVLLGDFGLLALRIAGELDHFHAVEQRTRNVLDQVRRGDEQHFTQVERNAQVVVGERVVLRRIEHLEQRARRIALEAHAQLVDFVEQEHGILGAGLLHPLDDTTRHGAHVGAPVATDVGLIARAAQRRAHVLAAERARDRLGDRRLAHARRAHEQQNRALGHGPGLGFLGVGDRAFVVALGKRRGRVFLDGLELRRSASRRSSSVRRRSAARATGARPGTRAPGPSRRAVRSGPRRGSSRRA